MMVQQASLIEKNNNSVVINGRQMINSVSGADIFEMSFNLPGPLIIIIYFLLIMIDYNKRALFDKTHPLTKTQYTGKVQRA